MMGRGGSYDGEGGGITAHFWEISSQGKCASRLSMSTANWLNYSVEKVRRIRWGSLGIGGRKNTTFG